MRLGSTALGPGEGEERGERTGGLELGGGEAAREREPAHVGAGDQAGKFGEQRGVGEDRWRQEASGVLAGGGSR